MKKVLVLPLFFMIDAYSAEKTPPSYESIQQQEQASSSRAFDLRDPLTMLDQQARDFFLIPLDNADIPLMLAHAARYEKPEPQDIIKANRCLARGLRTIAEALQLHDSDLDHAAQTFKSVINNRGQHNPQELFTYAKALLMSTRETQAQPKYALALGAYLERQFAQEIYGPELLMYFCCGGKVTVDNQQVKQSIIEPDFPLAKQYAENIVHLKPNARHLTWLGIIQNELGDRAAAKHHLKDALKLEPTNQNAKNALTEIQRQDKTRSHDDHCMNCLFCTLCICCGCCLR